MYGTSQKPAPMYFWQLDNAFKSFLPSQPVVVLVEVDVEVLVEVDVEMLVEVDVEVLVEVHV